MRELLKRNEVKQLFPKEVLDNLRAVRFIEHECTKLRTATSRDALDEGVVVVTKATEAAYTIVQGVKRSREQLRGHKDKLQKEANKRKKTKRGALRRRSENNRRRS